MKRHLRQTLLIADDLLARLSLFLTKESPGLVAILFHGLFLDEHEVSCGLASPQQGMTVECFRNIVEHFDHAGYTFVSPDDMRKHLSANHRYVLLTFDDGYYNNVRALPILEEYDIPAVFFISTDHIDREKSFWWDVVYRELKKRGRPDTEIAKVVEEHKRFQTAQIEAQLIAEFGPGAFNPVSDTDRPFSVGELKAFTMNKQVFLGNHTVNHAILPNYSGTQIREQIVGCQTRLLMLTGRAPSIIAYPNGRYTESILAEARNAGLEFGITTEPGRNHLPIEPRGNAAMILRRFVLWGGRSIQSQCLLCRVDTSLHSMLASARDKSRIRKSSRIRLP